MGGSLGTLEVRPVTLLVALALACRCPAEPAAPAPTHYPAWEVFVAAAVRGDLEAARSHAAALGEAGRGSEAGRAASMGKLGAAVGFVRFAEDGDELADAVASAAAACGQCHVVDGATGPPRPEWGHEAGAEWALWGLVWDDPAPPPAGSEPVAEELRGCFTAADAADPQARAARVVARCAECHAEG